MHKGVTWSPLAKQDLANVLDYLDINWSPAVSLRLIDKIESIISTIIEHPDRHLLINHELGIRKCVITKHNTLFYRELQDKIEIVRLFDTRQDPEKLGFEKQ